MPSEGYARILFSIAAIFNFGVAAAALFAAPELCATLRLDPITGTDAVFVAMVAVMIANFGYSYACVAYRPGKYRVYVKLGVIGKLLVVGTACWFWFSGLVNYRLPALASGDLVFAALFIDYLRRTRSPTA